MTGIFIWGQILKCTIARGLTPICTIADPPYLTKSIFLVAANPPASIL